MARKKGRFNAVKAAQGTAGAERQDVPAAVGRTEKIFRTALYARLSNEDTSKPGKADSSIEGQMAIMTAYVKEHSELADYFVYEDRGFSGTGFNRPDFKRMMEDVRSGKINCIVVKDLSRFGRDYLEVTNYIETIFPFLGVRFISVNDGFDTEGKVSDNKALEVTLKNLVNDMYAKDISRRISVVREQEAQRGKFNGRNAPYGYVVNEKDPLRHFLIDEPAAEVVRDIYRMAADGMPLRKISLTLQERNLSIPGQYMKTGHLYQEEGDPVKVWHIGTIGNILRKEEYIGNLVHGRRRVRLCENEKRHFTDEDEWIVTENAHEAIVDRETYNRVRELFAKKAAESTFSRGKRADIPAKEDKYKGLLYCGNCGRKINMLSSINGEKRNERSYFYRCNMNYERKKPGYCGVFIREWKLDQVVSAAMVAQIRTVTEKDNVTDFCEKAFDRKIKPLEETMRSIKDDIFREEYEGCRHYEDYVAGVISREELESLQRIQYAKTDRLKKKLSDMEEKYKNRKRELENVGKAVETVYSMDAHEEIPQELLRLMVDKIMLFPGRRLEIRWKFQEWFSDVCEKYRKGAENG